MKTLTEQEEWWDSLCDGCGKCCSIGKGVACPSLDAETNRCTVYDKRHETEACLKVTPQNVMVLHRVGILPASCAYVLTMKNMPIAVDSTGATVPVAGSAKLIPFELGHPDLTKRYILYREDYHASKGATSGLVEDLCGGS